MRVGVFGLGYVGTVSAACLAADGHRVLGVDVNPLKVEQVRAGHSPVIEPGLDELISAAERAGRLDATIDGKDAVRRTDLSLICVGTPGKHNGSLDESALENVCSEIGSALARTDGRHTVVIRSTVLPGMVEERLLPILEDGSGLRAGTDFGVCVNPEFLREGSAVSDYRKPSLIVIGELDRESGDAVEDLFRSIEAPRIRTDVRTAELVKYSSNAFHALKVAFANEIGMIAKAHGVDGQELMEIFCLDRVLNVSPAYLTPGFAFGGSCLPKDLRALVYSARQSDVDVPVLEAVLASNRRHLERAVDLVERGGEKRVGILGLSFKAGTDDVRESPTVTLVETLVGRGYHVAVFDDQVVPERLVGENRASLERELPHIAALMRASVDEVLADSDVVVIANGNPAYREVPAMLRDDQTLIDLVGLAKLDGRNGSGYDGICW
jgi:GDP-mannose 6-dehydrogenase